MNRIIYIAIVAGIASVAFSSCAGKDVILETPVQDESTGKWGYANKKGKIIVAGKYDLAEGFHENFGLAKVYVGTLRYGSQDEGEWGLIDRTGKEIVPCKYNRIYNFQEGLAEVYIGQLYNGAPVDGKFGFIDSTGLDVVPCKYDRVLHGFSEGLAAVNIGGKDELIRERNRYAFRGGKWGYIDRTGKEVIPFEYESADKFSEGKALVTISENGIMKEGYIDKTGKFIAPPVEHTFVKYAGKTEVDGGQTLVINLTLETKGDGRNITGYRVNIGRGNMTSYEHETFYPVKIGQDGTFSADKLSGTVKSNKIDCVFTISAGQKYTFSAYPEQRK